MFRAFRVQGLGSKDHLRHKGFRVALGFRAQVFEAAKPKDRRSLATTLNP